MSFALDKISIQVVSTVQILLELIFSSLFLHNVFGSNGVLVDILAVFLSLL